MYEENEITATFYYHTDHLGSASLITDYKGNEFQRIEYTPYGEVWTEKQSIINFFMPYKFTGKELDEETGLYYYGARYLDPKYSLWKSTDPALGEYMSGSDAGEGGVYNHINLNLYHYAGNNPVRYTDPDGRISFDKNRSNRIYADLANREDLERAGMYFLEPELGYTELVAYNNETCETRYFYSYLAVMDYLYPDSGKKFDLSISTQFVGDEDNPARAFFFDGQIVFDPENGNMNANTNFGITDFKLPILSKKNVNLDIDLQGISASALLGLQGNRAGFDTDFSIVNGTISLSFIIDKKKLNISFTGIIGASASFLVGPKGLKIGAALGPGGSVSVTVEDME